MINRPSGDEWTHSMVVVLLTTVFVGVLVYRRIKKRRARKRAIKLAAVDRTVSSPVAVDATTEESLSEDEVIIIGRESSPASSPPPYSRPSPDPYESSEGPRHLMVPGFKYPGTYVRDKPPPYSATVLQVQNS